MFGRPHLTSRVPRRAHLLLCASLLISGVLSTTLASSDVAGLSDTVLVLRTPLALSVLARALGPVEGQIVQLFHGAGTSTGGVYSRSLQLADLVKFYRDAYATFHVGQPQVFAVRFEGIVDSGNLGRLAEQVARREIVPADVSVFVSPFAEGGTVAAKPKTLPAEFTGGEWAPESGSINLYDHTGVCFKGTITCHEARGVFQTVIFERDHPGTSFDFDWAYEHDLKLYNPKNWNVAREFCPQQNDEFWTNRDAGIYYDSNFPSFYLDTNAYDPCYQEDLTIGSYRPRNFSKGSYYIQMFVAPGTQTGSPLALGGSALHKDCEFSPWCVGARGAKYSRDLIKTSDHASAPNCYTWRRDGAVGLC